MSINKDAISIGTDSLTGLELRRRFISFIGDRDAEYIKVIYSEFLIAPTGQEINHTIKTYFVRDYDSIVTNSDGTTTTTHHTFFTDWYNQLGVNYIVPAINNTLNLLPQGVIDSYVIQHS